MSAIKLLSTTHRRASISKENTVSHIYPLNVFSIGRSGYVESLRQDYMIFIPSWYWLLSLQVLLGEKIFIMLRFGSVWILRRRPDRRDNGAVQASNPASSFPIMQFTWRPNNTVWREFSILESNARQSKKDSSLFFCWNDETQVSKMKCTEAHHTSICLVRAS